MGFRMPNENLYLLDCVKMLLLLNLPDKCSIAN